MALIDSYDFLGKIKVYKEMIDFFKDKVLSSLKRNKYVHLSDEFSVLGNYSIKCSIETELDELDKFSKELSKFMAYQEALYEMMVDGILMPVKITNTYSYGNFNVKINYSVRSGNCTTSSECDISIPILENHTFMLKPSLMNK